MVSIVYANITQRFLRPEIPRWRMDTGSSYYFATKTISRWSQRLRICFIGHADNNRYKPEVETVPKTGSSHVTLFSEVGRRRFERSRSWNAPKHCISPWDRVDTCFRFWVITTSGLCIMVFTEVVQCRYLWKWIACARKHCRSCWDHVDFVFRYQIITTSGIRPPSWTSACRKRRVMLAYTPVKNLPPKNIGIAFEIASISDSVAKLLVLPVWATISTSVLYLMVFYIVGRCRRRWKWIGRARKLYRSRWDHVELSSRRLVINTSGFGGFLLPVCICGQDKLALESLAWMHMKT